MSHTVREKKKLLDRVRRIRGQLDAVERGLAEEWDPYAILQTVTACRGALNGLISEIIQGHVRYHLMDPELKPTSEQVKAAEQVLEVIKTYLK
jgi:DNA-binding FrmR family transcriptional regulator